MSKKERIDTNILLEERLNEEAEMRDMDENMAQKDSESEKENPEDEEDEVAIPAPQVRLGIDGQIIIDDQSLVL